jgi:hypothetical protein
LRGICGTLWYRYLERSWERWQAILPSALSAEDRERGYSYRLSVRQLRSLTRACSSAPPRCVSGLSSCSSTVINDPDDFGGGRSLNATNWPALPRVGHETNERLISAQLAACSCAPHSTTL